MAPSDFGMARPLRIEFSSALYHITSRSDRREAMFEDDEDRQRFLAVLGEWWGAIIRSVSRSGRISARVDPVCRPELGAGVDGVLRQQIYLEVKRS
jgi:hypothetical protein